MKYKPKIDFFRKLGRFLLTSAGQQKIEEIKITGTKIPYFFDLKENCIDEEEHAEEEHAEEEHAEEEHAEEEHAEEDEETIYETNVTQYQIWRKIYGFPYIRTRSPRKQEEYRKIEEKIKAYLEDQLKKTWRNYPLNRRDVFEDIPVFGGVPDGEEVNEEGNFKSILEIKTKTGGNLNDWFEYPPIKFQLQLGLYLYLRGIDTGYICICHMDPDHWKNINQMNLDGPLILYSRHPKTYRTKLQCLIGDMGQMNYEFEILSSWVNDLMSNNALIVFHIRINMDLFEKMMEYMIKPWYHNYRKATPELGSEELKEVLYRNQKW